MNYAVQESTGALRLVGPDEVVVSRKFASQAHHDSSEAAVLRLRTTRLLQEKESLRTSYNALSERYDLRSREYDNERAARRVAEGEALKLKTEVSELKDLLKQTVEYAFITNGSLGASTTKLKPEHGTKRLYFALGRASHLNIEITPNSIGDDHRTIRVTAPAAPDPDEPIVRAIAKRYPVSSRSLLANLRDAGLDITLKDQSKGETVAATPSLAPVSYMSRGGG